VIGGQRSGANHEEREERVRMTGLPAREDIGERSPVRRVFDPKAQVWMATVLSVVGFAEGWWWALFFGLLLTCAVATKGTTRLWRRGVEGLWTSGSQWNGAMDGPVPTPAVVDRDGKHAQRQLLEAIERHGEITPVRAALETTLTVAEAGRMLSELAQGGHLEVRAEGSKLLYGL
jgi:hypothetical protein